jgi:hypothetical protein
MKMRARGINMTRYSLAKNEYEMLLERGLTFKILKVYIRKAGSETIIFRELEI